MLKNYKYISFITFLVFSLTQTFSQNNKYKNVVLDGKPAKLNVATGEIILVKADTLTKTKIPIKVEDSIHKTGTSKSDFHLVKVGETLLDISEMYEVSINELKKANGLETTLVNEGDKIRVRNFVDHIKIEKSSVYNFNSDFHTVKEGETLYSISKRYEIELNELKTQNGLKSDFIKVGQKLKIRNFDLTNDLNSTQIWVVKEGDTLHGIAKKTGSTVSKLKYLNGLQNDLIKIGQKLVLK